MRDEAVGRFYSPQQAAEMLGLHVRTVRRYLREGRLEAIQVGNRYRIPREALQAFAGHHLDGTSDDADRLRIDVSSVVDLEPVSREAADRLTALLLGAAQRGPGDTARLRIDIAHDPERQRLKVIVTGPIAHTSAILALITTYAEA